MPSLFAIAIRSLDGDACILVCGGEYPGAAITSSTVEEEKLLVLTSPFIPIEIIVVLLELVVRAERTHKPS